MDKWLGLTALLSGSAQSSFLSRTDLITAVSPPEEPEPVLFWGNDNHIITSLSSSFQYAGDNARSYSFWQKNEILFELHLLTVRVRESSQYLE